ncbi:MAG: thiamine pyrophosphate-dependent dehydrogenase E1 component subunit alpha [Caldilinea sp.]|jgi:TPP-dependent pyruvate/acetoin dehydrogenase alpha subunit
MDQQHTIPPLKEEELLDLYRRMRLARRFEETVNELYLQGRIPSTLHLAIGQEATAAGALHCLRPGDTVFSTHRPHAHALAHGVSPHAMMAELMARSTGTCKGKGGSMHIGDFARGFVPAIAIVGGNVPIAAGAALAATLQGSDAVTLCFFGDGAANEGAWHEGVNIAAIWRLPVVFVCENNLYAASTPFQEAFSIAHVADRAGAYGIPGVVVDGNDVLAVRAAAAAAVARARSGEGPTLLECLTYRLCGHSRSDPRTYRTQQEEKEWQERDPLPNFVAWLTAGGHFTPEALQAVDQQIEATLADAIAFAEASPSPEPMSLYEDVYA